MRIFGLRSTPISSQGAELQGVEVLVLGLALLIAVAVVESRIPGEESGSGGVQDMAQVVGEVGGRP